MTHRSSERPYGTCPNPDDVSDSPATGKLRLIVDLIADCYWETDRDGRITMLLCGETAGPGQGRTLRLGGPCWELGGSPIAGSCEDYETAIRSRKPIENFVVQSEDASGNKRYLRSDGRPFYGKDGAFEGYCGLVRDVTSDIEEQQLSALNAELRHELRRLKDKEEVFSSTVDLAAIGICHVDLDGRFIHVNQRLVEMLGYSEEELIGREVKDISHADDRNVTDTMVEKIASKELRSFRVEKRYLRKDGSAVWVRINTVMKWDSRGEPAYHISTVEDISDRKIAQQRVEYLATHDELTDLPTRTVFSELLGRSMRAAQRRGGKRLAVLFIDLDRFKLINDSLGHGAGDRLLSYVSSRIKHCIRASDAVARHGGDEFVVLLENVDGCEDAIKVARKIIASIHEPITLEGHEWRATASIGIALFPEHGDKAGMLIRNADVAMYSAKQKGKNCCEIFSGELSPMNVERLTLEKHLRTALDRREFRIQYQPKVDAQSSRIVGVEALLRWWNHELGAIPPVQFVPVAEDTGLIVPIGRWVMRRACEQNMAWRRAGLPPVVMSVNLSPRQFSDPGLIDDISQILAETGMLPELLELEITESMLVSDIDRAIKIASAIRNTGVRLAIDDFGTGYSSLMQLKRFPLDTLKIDRSFIRDLTESSEDMAITEAIIAMGQSLGVSIVAEGVETPDQRILLSRRRCDQMQGFLFGKPSHPDQIAAALRRESTAGDGPDRVERILEDMA